MSWTYRVRDIAIVLALMTIALPIMLIVAVVVLVTSGRPIFFVQDRPGQHGRSFRMYKFRTMSLDTSLTDAERITRLGRVLRSTSLDELPELVNVLRGDMSLVGPRPLLDNYLTSYTGEQHVRHLVRPGVTGLAQVSGRNELSWQEKLAHDVDYVRRRSHLLDLKILWRTAVTVIGRVGISHSGHATMPRLDEC